jgi:hypothetical protein
VNFNTYNFWGFGHTLQGNEVNLELSVQPLNALKISASTGYSYFWRRQDQFINSVNFNSTSRTIVGEVKQKTLRFTGRAIYNLTPELTIQYYGQPFITRPLYDRFAYVSNALAKNYNERFYIFKNNEISFSNDQYQVDENRDGNPEYKFSKPDFNFVQFRSNLVVRWEYRSGSELYLVWSQGNTADAAMDLDTPLVRSLYDNTFAGKSRNIFLIKWTYRFLK